MGAVAGFLALAIDGMRSPDTVTIQAAYIAMDRLTTAVIVPLCWATLATGLLQSLGTAWGLFRHYWVIAKLLITLLSTAILVLHTQPIAMLGDLARRTPASLAEHGGLQKRLAADAGVALVALLLATILAVYKPKGVTPYGWRKQQRERAARSRS